VFELTALQTRAVAMNPDDSLAPVRELAARLIARRRDDLGDAPPSASPGAVALEGLSAELCRWIGDEGCRVLLGRALSFGGLDVQP